jgi:hypothetical protein
VIRIALWAAHYTIRPTDLHHVAFAVLVVGEKLNSFQQRFGRTIGVHHGQTSTLTSLVCQVLYVTRFQSFTMSKKSKRARKRKGLQARKHFELNKVKCMTDKPKTARESANTKKNEGAPPDPTITAPRTPTAGSGHTQTEATHKKRDYSQHVVGVIVASRGVISWIWKQRGFSDSHSGSITALATVVLAFLTYKYVSYSQRQWQTMQETLRLERPWIGPTQRGTIFDPKTKRLQGVIWHFQNGGRSVATKVVLDLKFKIGPSPMLLPAVSTFPKSDICENGKLNTGIQSNVAIPGFDISTGIGPSPDIVASFDAIYGGTAGLYIVGCIDYSDSSGVPWYRTNVNEVLIPETNKFTINRLGNEAR